MDLFELLKKSGIDPQTLVSFLNEETIPALSSLFGVDEKLLFSIAKLAPILLSENFDLRSFLPTALPVVVSYLASLKTENEKTPPENDFSESDSEFINEFKEQAGEAFSPLEIYLQSESAS